MELPGYQVGGVTVQDRLRGGGLGLENRPFGNIAVPFHERWKRTGTAHDDFEELPHRIGDRGVMTVDEQTIALVIFLLCMSRYVNLANMLNGKIGEIAKRGVALVSGRNEDVVNVEQE